MHLTVLSRGMLLKWVLPIVLMLALLGFWGMQAWGGGSGGGLEFADENPAYESVIVGPPEGEEGAEGAMPFVLYSIEVAEQTTAISYGGGGLAAVTLTNNIAEAIANGTVTINGPSGPVSVPVTANGDIKGNIVVSAQVWSSALYNLMRNSVIPGTLAPTIMAWFPAATPIQAPALKAAAALPAASGLSGVAIAGIIKDYATSLGLSTAGMPATDVAGAAINNAILMDKTMAAMGGDFYPVIKYTSPGPADSVVVATFADVICHPGKTVVEQVVMFPMVPPGSIIVYKAELAYAGSSPLF